MTGSLPGHAVLQQGRTPFLWGASHAMDVPASNVAYLRHVLVSDLKRLKVDEQSSPRGARTCL